MDYWIIVIVILVVYTPIFIWIFKLRGRKKKRISLYDNICKSLLYSFQTNKVRNLRDIEDFLIGSEDFRLLHLRFPDAVRDVLLRVKHLMMADATLKYTEYDLKIVDSLLSEIEAVIKEKKQEEPFEGVPDQEKKLLLDVLELSGGLKNNSVFWDKIIQLGELIKVREETLVKAGKDNAYSVRIGRISIAITIVTFIISLVVAFGLSK
jgi:hypothetical protein